MSIPDKMLAAVFHSPGDLRLTEVATPTPGRGEVLVQVRTCGICGTDLNLFNGGFKVRRLPLIPGHEFAGVIAALGEDVASLKIGDRVTVDINMTCGTCYWCRRSENLLCPSLQQIGIDVPGAFAQYVTAPISQIYVLPPALTFEQGASIEPLACAVHAQTRMDIQPGASVAVIGGGSMGIIHAQLARLRGAYPVILIGRTPSKLERAGRAGIEFLVNARDTDPVAEVKRLTGGRGADYAIEAAGSVETYEQAFKMVRRGGTIAAYGIPPQEDAISLRPFDFFMQEWTVIGAFVSHPSAWPKAITLLESGGIRPEVLFSMRVPLKEMVESVELIQKDKDLMKVFVVPDLAKSEKIGIG